MTMTIRPLSDADAGMLDRFVERIPDADVAFVAEDLRHPGVLASWFADPSVWRRIAEDGTDIIGAVSIHSRVGTMRHVGDLRLVVDPQHRRRGVGRALARAALLGGLERGVRKFLVDVTTNHTAAIAMFSGLGFEPEALLVDQIRDGQGNSHTSWSSPTTSTPTGPPWPPSDSSSVDSFAAPTRRGRPALESGAVMPCFEAVARSGRDRR